MTTEEELYYTTIGYIKDTKCLGTLEKKSIMFSWH